MQKIKKQSNWGNLCWKDLLNKGWRNSKTNKKWNRNFKTMQRCLRDCLNRWRNVDRGIRFLCDNTQIDSCKIVMLQTKIQDWADNWYS